MSKELNKKLSDIAIEYAENRARLAENGRAMRKLRAESINGYVDLSPYRERYLSDEFRELDYCCIVWNGWVRAVQECQDADDEEYDSEIMLMAVLMDEKKELNRECSKIRSRLRIAGLQLIKQGATAK